MAPTNVKISQVMTDQVMSISPNDTMDRVNKIFETQNFHHLPVVDKEGRVVGMLSKTDYFRIQHGFTLFKMKKAEEYNNAIARSLLVSEVMTKQIATLNPDDDLLVAVGIFSENLFHAMPVVDEHKHLVGIVSIMDLLNHAYNTHLILK